VVPPGRIELPTSALPSNEEAFARNFADVLLYCCARRFVKSNLPFGFHFFPPILFWR